MLVNFFGSDRLASEFDLVFLYRYSKRYVEGARKRMDLSRSIPVHLVTEPAKEAIVRSKVPLFAALQKGLWFFAVFIIKYYSIIVNRKRLISIFRRERPDIIHINNGGYPAATSCYSAILAAKKCGITNIVYMVNNMALGYDYPLRWFDRGLDSIVIKQVRFFINGSNNAGNRLKHVLRISDSQQITIRNGIIPRKVTLTREEFRKQYGINRDAFVFAEVANLEERKGHRVLLKAAQEYKVKNPDKDFIVLIEGSGPLKNEICSYISSNNMADYVRMIEVEQIYNLYNSIDVLILPSLHTEDFPNTIIEAMGMSIPVIGTSIAGIPEQIDDHQSGLLVAPGDSYALYKAMTELSTDINLYKKCKCQAKKKFDESYTAEISVENYIKLYRLMLNE